MEKIKKEIDDYLYEYLKNKGSYNKKIYEAMAYSINVGGKRIRPILMLLTYEMYDKDYKKILPAACALEMIHTYSLIHDDLPAMDNDDLRRGKPTNHKVFGEALAILAGDALLNEAFNILLKNSLSNGKSWVKAASLIGEASGADGMIGGQVVDILGENKNINIEELYYMHRKKTGELIKVAILSGSVLGEAEEKDLNILQEFGEKLGLAFQIKDDILDVVGNESKLGKTTKKDQYHNKNTFVSIYGLEKCKNMCCELTEQCVELLNNIDKDTSKLEELTLFLLKRDY
nr:farnesyl diphosphate synthase [Clostridium tetanomorphum]